MEALLGHRRYEENVKWIGEHYDELKAQYDGKWIAVLDRSVVGYDKSLEKLVCDMRRRSKESYGEVAFEFISRKPIEMIL